MNIKVITRHSPSNYGSLLQSIAIQTIIERMGHQCEIIDYQRSDERGLKMIRTQLAQKKGYDNPLKKLAYIAIRYPIEKLAQNRFDKMRECHLKMTGRCSSHEELAFLKADVFMTRSDQVWGPMMNGMYDTAYFLQFVAKDTKRLSYAASFGKTKFDACTEKVYKQMLAFYDKITVREDSAVGLIESWGCRNCLGQVLDPTLLMNGEMWSRLLITDCIQKRYENREYILVYQIHNDPQLSSYALQFAKRTGLQLIRVNPFIHQVCRGGKFICCPDVGEFLALIKNAAYMVTDSFHGTCFAINFGKQFVEILPNNSTGTRNQSILALTGLSNRIVTDFSDFSILNEMIDFVPVNKVLESERLKSLGRLEELLKNR